MNDLPNLPRAEQTPNTIVVLATTLLLMLITGVAAYSLGASRGKIISPENENTEVISTTPSPTTTTTSPTSSPTPQPTSKPTQQATASTTSATWKEQTFPEVGVTLRIPTGWKFDSKAYPDDQSYLIRLWKGSTPSTSTIQLTIKENWDNTGNAQFFNRDVEIGPNLYAAKMDPPKKDEYKLDRYQTNYYFELNGKVYILNCVHNWIEKEYQTCETLLKTGTYQ